MLARLFAILSITAVVAVACGGDDDGGAQDPIVVPSATEVPTAVPAESPTPEPTPDVTPTPFPEPTPPEPVFEDVNLLRCLDVECSRIQRVRLDEQQVVPPLTLQPGVRQVGREFQDLLVRSDGRPLVVVHWITPSTTAAGEADFGDELVAYSCLDVGCSSVTSQVVLTGFNGASAALLPNGSLAVSYQTGLRTLCLPGVGCEDPERDDLSSLELLLCADPDDCSMGSGRVVVLDRDGMTGLEGGQVLVGADGAPMVLYGREVGPEVTEVRLARCSDARCSDVSISTVLEPEFSHLGQGEVAADGSPVFQHRFLDLDEQRLVACEDPACASVVVSTSFEAVGGRPAESEFLFGGIAVGEGDRMSVLVGTSIIEDELSVGMAVSVVTCPDRGCDEPQRSPVLFEHQGATAANGFWGARVASMTPDGRAMFTYGIGGAGERGEDSYQAYLVCDDVECTSATHQRLDDPTLIVDEWDPDAPPGLFMYVENLAEEAAWALVEDDGGHGG